MNVSKAWRIIHLAEQPLFDMARSQEWPQSVRLFLKIIRAARSKAFRTEIRGCWIAEIESWERLKERAEEGINLALQVGIINPIEEFLRTAVGNLKTMLLG